MALKSRVHEKSGFLNNFQMKGILKMSKKNLSKEKSLELENSALKMSLAADDCLHTAELMYPGESNHFIQDVATELMRIPIDSVNKFSEILRDFKKNTKSLTVKNSLKNNSVLIESYETASVGTDPNEIMVSGLILRPSVKSNIRNIKCKNAIITTEALADSFVEVYSQG